MLRAIAFLSACPEVFSARSSTTTALLRLAPLPPHPSLVAPKKPSLLAPLGSGRRATGALQLARAAGDGLADQTTVYNCVYGADVREGADLFYAAGAGGLGLSLVLIHIYVTPIKRFLQALWDVGVLGSVGTYALAARPLDEGLVRYVAMCSSTLTRCGSSGRPSPRSLASSSRKVSAMGNWKLVSSFAIPILLLGHLSGFMDDGVKLSLLALGV
uniref:Uncharacterized protein n=1 Tax=Hordeum vulgare subsp. vulgare TaxID=112509 RepID=A0A8I7BFY6_HORVV